MCVLQEMKEDGCHLWKLKHFTKSTYCNVCFNLLVGWGGKQGLACVLCKYTAHERCVAKAETSCIKTYNANPSKEQIMLHHWLDSNNTAKCAKCKTNVPIFQGKRCRWCKNLVGLISCWSGIKMSCSLLAISVFYLHEKRARNTRSMY